MNNDTRFNVELPDAPANMDDTEWQARLELALAYRLVDYYGWTSVVYNHITLQIPGTAHLLINPFGLRYDEVRASDLVKIDLDGNILSATDWPVNLAGYVIHSTIHRARPDLHCVLHTHESMSQSLCATNSKVIPLTQEGCQFYERVGYHDFQGIVLDGSEGPQIIEALGQDNHTLVLHNHGLITAGSNAAWAVIRHYAFIRNAEVQIRAMATGQIKQPSVQAMERTREQFEGGSAQANAKVRHPEWSAWMRLIDGIDPSWKY
jgi:ribulose-5-phosphate 4-epimerase/fuculose-1-phosphate aldolase